MLDNRNKRKFDCNVATAFRSRKRQNTGNISPITIGYLTTKPNNWKEQNIKRLRILFDSGCEATLVNKNVVKKLTKVKCSKVNWTTKAGSFQTTEKCEIQLKLPALHEHKEIKWNAYVEPSPKSEIKYDLIIGRDLILIAGIDFMFSQGKISWDGADIDMRHPDFLSEER